MLCKLRLYKLDLGKLGLCKLDLDKLGLCKSGLDKLRDNVTCGQSDDMTVSVLETCVNYRLQYPISQLLLMLTIRASVSYQLTDLDVLTIEATCSISQYVLLILGPVS